MRGPFLLHLYAPPPTQHLERKRHRLTARVLGLNLALQSSSARRKTYPMQCHVTPKPAHRAEDRSGSSLWAWDGRILTSHAPFMIRGY